MRKQYTYDPSKTITAEEFYKAYGKVYERCRKAIKDYRADDGIKEALKNQTFIALAALKIELGV